VTTLLDLSIIASPVAGFLPRLSFFSFTQIYPPDIIKHINFLQYFYKIADNELFARIIELFAERRTNARQAIEDDLEDQNLLVAILT
jgi:hypothetical protein